MIEAIQFEFIQKALIAGFLVSIICGVIGTLVVVNRLTFLAGGIAHTAYGGIGLAFYFKWPYMACTILFSIFAAMIMGAVTINDRHRSDTIIGVLWALGMALGVILTDLSPGYNVDLMSYLFGSILAVTSVDLLGMFIVTVVIVGVVIWFYHYYWAMAYDEEFAKLRGVPVKKLYFLLLGMIAIAIIMAMRVVGLILVIALLTIPPYIAEKRCRSLFGTMFFSGLLSALFILTGLWSSYTFNLPAGASIIMTAGLGFFLSFFLSKWAK